MQREHWQSYSGFLFAAIGSAVGIGNIWRFPYLVGTNGGGAFLVPYLLVMISFGLAFMMLELAVGRYYNTSIIGSLANIHKKFKWIGIFTVVVATVVLSYYLVILGWILSFLVMSIMFPTSTFRDYTDSIFPLVSFFAVLAINYVIINKGITSGVERINKYGVTVLIILIVPLTIYAVTLPGSENGIAYYLSPDFTRFSDAKIWTSVFGQVFFSLSIGFGTLVAYGSYLGKKYSLPRSSSIILLSDVLISFTAGFMIFSILFSFDMEPDQGVSLVFQVMPKIFSEMEFGIWIGIVFFLLLLVAGLTSSIGLFQVPVSAFEDSKGYSRKKATLASTGIVGITGIFSALSYSQVNLTVFGIKVLDLMDDVFGTYGLSISAVLFSIVVLWFMDKKGLLEQIGLKDSRVSWILVMMKFLLPALIVITIVFNLLSI